ncbi:MAG: glycerate kinase [Clostridia bacterium]|nr:glycerate kinase [Clostridia bacterium]
MNIVVAIDSFKGSLSSTEAGNIVKNAALKVDSFHNVTVRPLADGGEGTVEALSSGVKGRIVELDVTGPLFNKVTANYFIMDENNTAVIEMASAAGLTLLKENERNPLKTTTFGVGEIILDAISRGCRRFIVGIGGSATNDGGIGMLGALGYEFLDSKGEKIALNGEGLKDIKTICADNVNSVLKECAFRVACDVKNPLCGELGCSKVFAPQKGADAETVEQMDLWLKNYSLLVEKTFPDADSNFPGAGAAGGLGFAFKTFLNAQLDSGVKIILEETKLEEYIKNADLVVTGEGRLDYQTAMGKAPIGVAELSKKHNKKVIAFAGSVTDDATVCNEKGIDAYFSIMQGVSTLDDALNKNNAEKNLFNTAYQVFKLLDFCKK